MHLKRINSIKVKAPDIVTLRPDQIKGYDMFQELYTNIFLCSKRKKGKTNIIREIIKACCDKNTIIIAFVSTLYNDALWKIIREYCKKKNIPFKGCTSLYDGKTNLLNKLVSHLQEEAEEREEEEQKNKQKNASKNLEDVLVMNDDDKIKPKKPKVTSPKYLIILDDMSLELRSPAVTSLLKNSRHFLCKLIVSSQDYKDIHKQGRSQLDNILIFKGIPEKTLECMHDELKLDLPFHIFLKWYKWSTQKKFMFFYIDCGNETYRQNFDIEINPDDKDISNI